MTRRSNGWGWTGRKLSGASIERLLSEADIVPVCLRGPDGTVLGLNHAYRRLVGTMRGAGTDDPSARRHLPDGKWRHASYTTGGRRVHALVACAVLPGTGSLQVTLAVDVTKLREDQLRLRASQRLADELHRVGYATTIEYLSSWLIHEMSQPLMATLATAQGSRRLLSRRRPDLREIEDSIEAIVDYQRRVARVLERLRGVLPRNEPPRAHLNMTELILDVIRFLRERGDLSGVRVRVCLPRKPLWVDGARVQLRQVVLSLLLSSVESMQSTPVPQRRISVRMTPENGQSAAHIAVGDSGNEARNPDCLQFFAAMAGDQPSVATLGLPVAGAIVLDHGGRIWLRPRRRGNEFHVVLPVVLHGED